MALSPSPTSQRAFRRLWRRPGYPGFVLTVGLSRTSATMFNTAGVLLILARTHSAALAGVTAAAAVLPGAVTGPVLGAWLDVARRRRVLIVFDQLLSVVALIAIVAVAGHAPDWTIPAITVLYSATRPLSVGSFFSALAEIAGPELLDQASAVEATSLNLSVIVGPALAGVLAGIIGAAATVEVQAALTLVVAALVAANPAFEARGPERAASVSHALRAGLTALSRERVLLATSFSSGLAAFGWGLMLVGFPLYAARSLHAGAHASGYLWAAVAAGSILGTFGLRGSPSLRRVGLSYGALGVSALAWPVAGTLAAGIGLIGLTGFLEGPAYSGTIALRQRHAPASVRAQVMTTLNGATGAALAAGAALGGALADPGALIVAFTAVNLVAAGGALAGAALRPAPPA
ncbi:MAG TPA: MFS transporter [Solirubrobacteraceae bacterium]|nr:MFS transporter [Solirubrobacteraceae bacterium]